MRVVDDCKKILSDAPHHIICIKIILCLSQIWRMRVTDGYSVGDDGDHNYFGPMPHPGMQYIAVAVSSEI